MHAEIAEYSASLATPYLINGVSGKDINRVHALLDGVKAGS